MSSLNSSSTAKRDHIVFIALSNANVAFLGLLLPDYLLFIVFFTIAAVVALLSRNYPVIHPHTTRVRYWLTVLPLLFAANILWYWFYFLR